MWTIGKALKLKDLRWVLGSAAVIGAAVLVLWGLPGPGLAGFRVSAPG